MENVCVYEMSIHTENWAYIPTEYDIKHKPEGFPMTRRRRL